MKKIILNALLISFCIALLSEVSAQTTYNLISNVSLEDNDNGNTVNLQWSNNSAWSSTIPSPAGSSGEIIVPFGVTLTIGATFRFYGSIVVKNGGVIIFDRDNPNEGELIMDVNSKIVLEEGASISSTGPADHNKNYLQIGDFQINGEEINSLPNPPFILDKNYVECMDRFGVASCAPTPQPVTLLYFKAIAQQQSVGLSWASSKAWDFSHYELERSADGVTFDFVATIDAAEFSNEIITYSYSDRQPLFGMSYYRLKAVDIDGSFEYKDMAGVKFGAESFKVYPNPSSQGFITISWSHAGKEASAILKDNMGRTVRTTQLSGTNEIISTEGLATGVYHLSVQGPAGQKQAQVLIR